ncbi:chaperone DnaK [Apiospora rasikravindrae]|uniref:Chaperone DnaK n=1 Tax=Apiospora rasikravindrae TaxID=990691 RepID=A0ABR1T0T2_9PEZI
MGNYQRAKFWGTLFFIIASLATVTFLARSGLPRYWDEYGREGEYGPIIGIDIGHTYARVAYIPGDFLDSKVLKDGHGNTSIPTCVAFSDADIVRKSADTHISSEDALRQAHKNPKRTVCNVARFLESRWSSPEVQYLLPDLPYQLVKGENDRVAVQITIAGKPKTYSPTALVGILMGRLKSIAEEDLGVKVRHAALAVPADFDVFSARDPGEANISLGYPNGNPMGDAAALAGLTVLRFVREPVAAAIAYGVDRAPGERNVLVYDMGGEKTQISVIEVEDGVLEILSTVKVPVGGRHFNDRVVKELLRQFNRKNGIQAADITADSLNRLREGVEMAKRRLSTQMATRVEIPNFHKTQPLIKTVSRAKFEELNNDLFQSTMGSLQKLLVREDDVKLKPGDIDDVIFSGGSSFIPKLRFQLELFFKTTHAASIADEAVVTGAAMQGGVLSGYSESMGQPMDIRLLSIGVESADGLTVPVIRRYTPVPTRKSVKVMTTRYQGQESKVVVNIIEGERLHARDNRLVGELDVSNILSPISSTNRTDYLNLAMELDAQPSDDTRDDQLVESLVRDGEKHQDVEGPLMDQYKQLVDLESFALAVKKEVLAKMVLPDAARGHDESMRQILKAAESALSFRLDEGSPLSPLGQIANAKFQLERIVERLLVDDLLSFEYDQIHKVGSSSTTGAVDDGRDEL